MNQTELYDHVKFLSLEDIASVCHEANRSYCQSLGDFSQPEWKDAPEWQRSSAIQGVRAQLDSNLTLTPEESHASWSDQKIREGWQYGTEKNAELKTHPCLVNYQDLPAEQKAKDYIFLGVVRACAAINLKCYHELKARSIHSTELQNTKVASGPQVPRQVPSIGRIVHYQKYGTPGGEHKPEPSVAIITKVLNEETKECQLFVVNPNGLYFNPTPFSEEPKPGHWNWPPRTGP